MSESVYSVTPRETTISAELRALCIREIGTLEPDLVCKQLGFGATALKNLLAERHWDLSIAFRVADILGLKAADLLFNSVATEYGQLPADLRQAS